MDKRSLLIKYYEGKCSRDEIEYLLDHLQPEDVEEYDSVIQDLWNQFQKFPQLNEDISDKIYQSILRNAQISSTTEKEIKPEPKTISFYYKIAAVSIGLLFLAGILFFMLNISRQQLHKTSFGEKKTILLPDSSEVTLNSNSSVSYSTSDFSSLNREIWLTGEAYFNVRKKTIGTKRARFTVHTSGVNVEVLGTKFNVNARRKMTKVVLETGKVRLDISDPSQKEELIMKPGDFIAYSRGEKKVERKVVNPKEYSSWLKDMMIFNEVPLEQIAQSIEDNFGYKMVIDDAELKAKKYKGAFPRDNIDVLLTSLSRSFGLEVIKYNDVFILKKTASK